MADSIQRRLRNLAIRQQILTERYKVSQIRSVVGPLNKVLTAAERVLGTLRGSDIGDLSRAELNALLRRLTAEADRIYGQATERIYKKMPDFADAQASTEALALKTVASSLRIKYPKATAAYANALAQPVEATGEFLETFVGNWKRKEIARLNSVFTNAWSRGVTNQRLLQAVRGTKAKGYVDGIIFTSKRNGESIVRTAIQHVANSAKMATWEENSEVVVGYIWVSTLDSVTTKQCRSLDGREYKLGKGPRPPIHYSCRSTTVAKLDPKLGLDFLEEGATRSSLNGYVPAKETYYSWLKDQPRKFQDQAMGPKWAKLFRDGGLSPDKFADLSLDRNFKPLTLAQFRKAAPKAFENAGLN